MINRIFIENYRSIEQIEIRPENLCALIGPNSSGKTNILKAISILLGDTYPTERAFKKDDFFDRDISRTITIQINFDEALDPVYLSKKGGGKENCECVSMQLTHSRVEGSSTWFMCTDRTGDEFYGNGKVREQVSFIYIPSERHLEKQLSISNWTLLGKILKKVDENFKASDERIEAFEEAMKPPKEILEKDFDGGISFANFKEVLIGHVNKNTKGHSNSCDLELEIYDPLWYYKMLQIITHEEGKRFNVEEIGSGTQNLILLSIFQAFAHLMKGNSILAIEEPELYLFPFAQRRLYNEFKELAEHSQIFYTTHSPNFVDISSCDQTCIIRKIEGKTEKLANNSLGDFISQDDKIELHLISKFNTDVNEIFFADKIIIVEGATEKNTIPFFLQLYLGEEYYSCNHYIINANGKDLIPFFIKVCEFLGLDDYFVIYDSDLDPEKSPNAIASAQTSTEQITALLPDSDHKLIELDFDFESVCQYPRSGGNSKKIKDALDWANIISLEQIPPVFEKLRDFIQSDSEEQIELEVVQSETTIPSIETFEDDDLPF